MSTVVIAPMAEANLMRLTDAIAANNGKLVAAKILSQFQNSFEHHARHPKIGRSRSRMARGLRSWPVASWVVFYRPAPSGIEVVRVIHGRRRITRSTLASQP
jgi:toxin ParE1/3/4